MESIAELISWQRVTATVTVYVASLVIYRLFLHPLSHIPGPKLAATTRWYEAYYDVIKGGRYTFQIEKMHKQYGPIIRISPHELHVNDPDFYDTIYRHDGRWDKYSWAVDAFAHPGATIFTADHHLHKIRRQPLGSYFSKAKTTARQDMIQRHITKFCDRAHQLAISGATFDLGAAINALTRDIGNEFIIGKSYNSLDRDNFDAPMVVAGEGGGEMWRLSKHVRFVAPLMTSIPVDWVLKTAEENVQVFFQYLKETKKDTETLMTAITTSTPDDTSPRTIVHEIMESSLPASEKTLTRVFQDVTTMVAAGSETTASALRLIVFSVFSDSNILQRLRAELSSANAGPAQAVELKTLEQLPYLTSVLMEGIRLSPALASRMGRVAPDRDLFYGSWRIPAGTPVGMTTMLIHTDENIYPDPQRFNPDRWMGPDAEKPRKAFAPFSKGTRNCLGMHLGWAEMYLFVSVAVQTFSFQFHGASAEDFRCASDNFTIGTRSKGILKAAATIYNS